MSESTSHLPPTHGMRPICWRLGLALWALALLALALLVIEQLRWGNLGDAGTLVRDRLAALEGQGDFPGQTATGLGLAPDFTLPLFDGGSFRLADHRGKVVVVNFWASWCVPCRNEAPRLEAAAQQYRSRGLLVVGVDTEDTNTDGRAFIRQFGLTYPTGPDHGLTIAQAYGVSGLPTTFFLRRTGQIERRWLGELQQAQLQGFIDEVLR
ncbi:MAG: TlpA family protein disulfide reductase [Chloroflexi bacterium]|nr:TlpA family protein disulfide reductase [Chloroflexota bacterium]